MYKIKKITFHNHPILGNLFLDFCNQEGKSVDTVILAGENGTGKSTILNAIYTVVSQVADFEADVEYETNDTAFVMTYRYPLFHSQRQYQCLYRCIACLLQISSLLLLIENILHWQDL